MAETMTGGCLCGAVRYEITVEPLFSGKCYCEDCRRGSAGAGHSNVMAIPAPGFKMTGETTGYATPAVSGKPISRHFCPVCGSGIYSAPESMAGVLMVRASTLDDPEAYKPQSAIFVSRAPSWDQPPEGLPTFAEMPPAPH
jgi:hypothetical protein